MKNHLHFLLEKLSGTPYTCSPQGVLIVVTLLRLRLTCLIRPRPLQLSTLYLQFRLFHILSMYHESRDINVFMNNCRMQLFLTKSDIQVTNLLILSLWFDTKDGSYLYNWVNFKEYSSTLMPPFLRLINLSTFTSPFSRGKHLPRYAFLNSSHSIGPLPFGISSFH